MMFVTWITVTVTITRTVTVTVTMAGTRWRLENTT